MGSDQGPKPGHRFRSSSKCQKPARERFRSLDPTPNVLNGCQSALIEHLLNNRSLLPDEPILLQTTDFVFTPVLFRHPIAACGLCRKLEDSTNDSDWARRLLQSR